MRLLSTKTHATLVRERVEISLRRVGRDDTKTHVKKYTIFSCNKMAVSDHRPFILIFAEGETMVLYTAIPNSTNSKRVATKYKGYFFSGFENNGVLDTHQEPIEPIEHHQWNLDMRPAEGVGCRPVSVKRAGHFLGADVDGEAH